MSTLEETENALRDTCINTTPELDTKIVENAGAALDAALRSSRAGRDAHGSWFARALRSRPLQVAVAAATVCGLLLFTGHGELLDTGGVAWAQVPQRMAQVDRLMFRLSIRLPDETGTAEAPDRAGARGKSVSMAYFESSTLGSRWNLYEGEELASSIVYPARADTGIAINYAEKTWARVSASAGAPAGIPASPVLDPESWVRRFLEREHTEIGRSTIDGVEVEGIEVRDPPTQFGPGGAEGPQLEGRGRLWVGVASGLPVRIELQQEGGRGNSTWTLDFRWGSQVDAAAFDARIPEGFTLSR